MLAMPRIPPAACATLRARSTISWRSAARCLAKNDSSRDFLRSPRNSSEDMAGGGSRGGARAARLVVDLLGEIPLFADLVHDVQLRLEPFRALFLSGEDAHEQLAGSVVALCLA